MSGEGRVKNELDFNFHLLFVILSVRLFVCSFVRLFVCALVRSFVRSFVNSRLCRLCVCSFVLCRLF